VRPRLILLRHGVTAWNREGRFQGHRDPPLADDGRVEARLLGARMAANPQEHPRLIVTSTLARARQTAEVVAEAIGESGEAPTLREDARLMEVGQGEWEGRTHRELAETDAERYRAWRSQAHSEPPGAEPLPRVAERVGSLLDELTAAGDGPVCLVSHGGTLRIVASLLLLQLDQPRFWAVDLDNCSLSALAPEGSEAWTLERWNDTAHLLGRTEQHVDESDGAPLAL
jgi:probable phosphoglycerate mutase